MLLSSNLLKYLEENILICDYFGGIPFKWNKKRNRLKVKNRTKLQIYGIRLYLAIFYQFLVMFQVISTWKTVTILVVTHNIMFISSYVLISTCGFVFYKNAQQIADLFNQLVNYEERNYKSADVAISMNIKGTKTMIVGYMIRMLTMTGLMLPTFYHLDIIRNPCFPVYLGYWLTSQCVEGKLGQALPPTWSAAELGTKLGVAFISYLNWNLLVTGFGFYLSVGIILTGHAIRSYIAQYGRDMKRLAKQDKNNQKQIWKQTMAFRELQVIGIQYRELFSLTRLILMQVVCLYNTLTVLLKGGGAEGGSVQIGLNLVYLVCTVKAACEIVVLYGILADVYSVAKNVHKQLDSTPTLKKSKWFARFFRSCPILRIYLGGSNFLDELTPLTCEDFAIDQTVGLLLLKK